MIRRLVLAVVVVLASLGGLVATRLGDRTGVGEDTGATPVVVAARPETVARLVVSSGPQRAELARRGEGTWIPGPGTPLESPVLLLGFEERLLPLHGYRRLTVDADRPEFGLTDAEIRLEVEDAAGRVRRFDFGTSTFTGGGFYARRAGERDVYLVARRTMDDLRSLVRGRRVDTPRRPEETESVKKVTEAVPDAPVESPWLRQAVEAGAEMPEGVR